MKIYFCDGCNESIPIQDIKDNKAITLKGKIYCKNCNPLKDVLPPASRFSLSAFTLFLMVVVVCLFAVVLFLMWGDRDGSGEEYAASSDLQELDIQVVKMRTEIMEKEDRLKTLETERDRDQERLARLESDLVVLSGDLMGLRSENENMTRNFQAVTNTRTRLDEIGLKQDELSASQRSATEMLDSVRSKLQVLEEQQNTLASSIKMGALTAAGVQGDWNAEPSEVESPLLTGISASLASKDAGERFEAVYKVMDDRIKAALPYVLPLIEDPDQFVQVGAIQTVGEFLYLDALPALVKVLRDPDVTVRDESLRQLLHMTGKSDLDFDVRASEAERDKAIRKWEKWVKENR